MDEPSRMRRLRSRTLRWNEPGEVDGYRAAEIEGGRVRWFAWSHLAGEGCRELGVQSGEALLAEGPPIDVPPAILGQIHEALAIGREA